MSYIVQEKKSGRRRAARWNDEAMPMELKNGRKGGKNSEKRVGRYPHIEQLCPMERGWKVRRDEWNEEQ